MHSRFRAALFLLLVSFVAASCVLRAQDDANQAAAPDAPGGDKPVGRTITLSDFGAEDLAYLAIPSTQPTMGVVLVPDAYGLDDFTKTEADRLASLGYLAMAVDIYNGHRTTDPEEIASLTANQEAAAAMKTINAGIRVFHESPKFRVGHVVVMGWGNGARYVFQAAREDKTIDGAIMFYGPVESNVEKIGKFAVPVCAFYPESDPAVPQGTVEVFERMMKDSGNDFSAYFIAAGPGWSNPVSKNYSAIEDKEAWKAAMPFLVRIGSEPEKQQKPPSIIDKAKDKIEGLFK